LIEVLTVIVVFLVGILAVVQVFPPGLAVLRTNRAQTQAISLARAEVQRVLGQSAQIPERIVAGSFDGAGNIFILSQTDPRSYSPPVDAANVGLVDNSGQVIVTGNPIGHWSKLTSANKINRIIGEGRPVPQPTIVGGVFGSRMQLAFAPIYYIYDAAASRSRGQVLSVYGNDLRRASGDANDDTPDSSEPLYDTDVFYYTPGEQANLVGKTPAGFENKDQIWIGRLPDVSAGTLLSHNYRISMSFTYNDGVADRVVEAIFAVDANVANAYYRQFNNYAVISLPDLLSGSFVPAGYRGVEVGSIRVQRVFSEVPFGAAFDVDDPYQFSPWNHAMGTILINPVGANVKVKDVDGNQAPLMARVDYSVYDWRIIRDDFTIPSPVVAAAYSPTMKLLVNSIKPASGTDVDGSPYGGIGLVNDLFMGTPNLTGVNGQQDFVLIDLATGGIVAGNSNDPTSAYLVEKSSGNIQFRDTDSSDGFAVTGRVWVPTGQYDAVLGAVYVDSGPVELAGRRVRALYMARGEFAVQVMKASATYNVVFPSAANQLVAGQCYEGASNGWGSNNRLYFPLIDSGQKVTVGELWVAGAGAPVIRDRDLKIDGVEQIGGVTVAYAQLPSGSTFDPSRNNYAVRRVNGASIKVRSFYNPDSFALSGNNTTNFERIQRWLQRMNVTTTETFDAGGKN
jgi:type II secretory pathway pseudopilin PulG